MKKLIADAGSTKIDWALTGDSGKAEKTFSTEGLNVLLAEREEFDALIAAVKESLGDGVSPDEIYYYGAGCATPTICAKVENALRHSFDAGRIVVASDLLGAARSLLGHSRGIACILGTGSNSCLYDGEKIERNVPSLGFILGDEGSGAALGKRLVSDAFKGHLPKVISDEFLDAYGLTLDEILNKVYRSARPNKFLASLVPFLYEHLWNPYVYSLVRREFENFLLRNVSPYQGARILPIAFTGSIAFHFKDVLADAAGAQGFRIGAITARPLEGLITYHE